MISKKNMLILGVVLVIVGAALIWYGDSLNNNWQAVWNSAMSGGSGKPGNSYIGLGGAALAFGAILGVLGFLGLKKDGSLPIAY